MLDVLRKKDHEEFRAESLDIVADIGHRLVCDVLWAYGSEVRRRVSEIVWTNCSSY